MNGCNGLERRHTVTGCIAFDLNSALLLNGLEQRKIHQNLLVRMA